MWFKKEVVDENQLEILAGALRQGITKLLRERTEGQLPVKSQMEQKNIIEFMRKMRGDSIDKFTQPAFVSTVNYYANERDMTKRKPLGALVIYIEEDYVPVLLRTLKYPEVDFKQDDALKDACGTLANLIAGRFKSEMLERGFTDLEMSHFTNYRKSAMLGVDFDNRQTKKYEITFFIHETKRLIVELTMGPVPKKG